jgi:hypothetical protein
MTPVELYRHARSIGLDMDVDGDRLLVWPAGKVPADLLPVLREHKPALIAWLAEHHRKGWGSVPPEDLPLNPAMPRPNPRDRTTVLGFAMRQAHTDLLRWIVRRESAYYDGPGQHWDCAVHAYAAARDLAVWQLNEPETEAIKTIEGMEDTAESMR